MRFNLLGDRSKQLISLVNCYYDGADFLLCGIAIFRGGISGTMQVGLKKDGIFIPEFIIEIPEQVKECSTYETILSSKDDVRIKAKPLPKALINAAENS